MNPINLARAILALTVLTATWIYPVNAASALLAEPKLEETKLTYGPYVGQLTTDSTRQSPGVAKSVRTTNADKVRPKLDGPTIPNGQHYSGKAYSKEEVQQLIIDYSREYRIDSATPLCIAKLESGYNQFSKNKSSSASGVYQYLSGTWRSTDEGKAGLSVFDASANIKAAIKYMASRQSTQPWVVGKSCPPVKTIN